MYIANWGVHFNNQSLWVFLQKASNNFSTEGLVYLTLKDIRSTFLFVWDNFGLAGLIRTAAKCWTKPYVVFKNSCYLSFEISYGAEMSVGAFLKKILPSKHKEITDKSLEKQRLK